MRTEKVSGYGRSVGGIRNTNKNVPEFAWHDTLTESEILLLKRRLNDNKIQVFELKHIDDGFGYRLTAEQERTGLAWLLDQWKGKSGVERKNNPFEYYSDFEGVHITG